jgi:hypothetical protein
MRSILGAFAKRRRSAGPSIARCESIERSMTFLQTKKNLSKHRGFFKLWCPVSESNQGHEDFQSSALPTELTGHRNQMCTLREARIKASEMHYVKGLFSRWHVSFSLIDLFAGKELFSLLREVSPRGQIHHIETHFIN